MCENVKFSNRSRQSSGGAGRYSSRKSLQDDHTLDAIEESNLMLCIGGGETG